MDSEVCYFSLPKSKKENGFWTFLKCPKWKT
jgi:hypothetical protein